MRSIRLSTRIVLFTIIGLVIFGCSRKSDDPVPERKGDLRVAVTVTDETGRLGDLFPVKVSLFDDTLHQYEIDSKRIMIEPAELDSVDFSDINARSAFYYIEVKIDFHDSRDETCGDTPVFIQDGVVRRVGVEMLYRLSGVTCSQF
ncbi:MAG: hypothetical protein ABIJ61_11775 [bacterium]